MSALKEYSIIGSSFKGVMTFKYFLNGTLAAFQLSDGYEMNEKQQSWLQQHFPFTESQIKHFKAIRNFTVTEGEFEIIFNDFWQAYKMKIGKFPAEKAWAKLNTDDQIKAIAGIKPYLGYLARKRGIEKARASTYLNQKFFNDEWGSTV